MKFNQMAFPLKFMNLLTLRNGSYNPQIIATFEILVRYI